MNGARAGMAMSLATFAMAAASAGQAVLYLGRFGTNARTDGFFVAFALYSTFGVFSQSLRLTSVGLLVEPARLSVRQLRDGAGCGGRGGAGADCPAGRALAELIAPGLTAGARQVTAAALPVLGVAMVLQLWAAAGRHGAGDPRALWHDRGRLHGGGGGRIDDFSGADEPHGRSDAGVVDGRDVGAHVHVDAGGDAPQWGLGRVADGAGRASRAPFRLSLAVDGEQAAPARANRLASALRELGANCGVVLGRTAIYLAFNLLFVITLAFSSRSAAGETTVLSYAYLFASYLVAGTGMALGMSSIPDMTRQARAQREALVASTVPRGFRYAMLIVAPALAGLIASGAPLIHALLPGSLSLAEVHTLRVFAALLVPWTVAALLVNFLLPVLLAVGRTRLLGVLAPLLLAGHVAATAAGAALWGVDGAVGAMWVAPACLAAVLLVSGSGREDARPVVRQLSGDGARFLGLAAVAFGAGWAVGDALGADLAQALVAGIVGCAAYLAGLRVVARRQLEVLVSAVAARPAPA